jgi:hypothetical protein
VLAVLEVGDVQHPGLAVAAGAEQVVRRPVLDRRLLAERLIAVLGASRWLGRATAALSADYALP